MVKSEQIELGIVSRANVLLFLEERPESGLRQPKPLHGKGHLWSSCPVKKERVDRTVSRLPEGTQGYVRNTGTQCMRIVENHCWLGESANRRTVPRRFST